MRKLVICFLFLSSSLGFSADTLTLNVDSTSQQFNISLPANPTTGFQWTAKQYNKTILKLESSQYLPPKTNLMGAGGSMRFIFSRVKGVRYPSSTILQFRYARSWERGRGIEKKVIVNFRLVPKAQSSSQSKLPAPINMR